MLTNLHIIMHFCSRIMLILHLIGNVFYASNKSDLSFDMMSFHAERNLIIKHFKHFKYKRQSYTYNILVIRLSKNGNLGSSKPCQRCINELKKSHINIKYIYYSNQYSNIIRENIKNIQNSHLSLAYRKTINKV